MNQTFFERAKALSEQGQAVKAVPVYQRLGAAMDLAENTADLLLDFAKELDRLGGKNGDL